MLLKASAPRLAVGSTQTQPRRNTHVTHSATADVHASVPRLSRRNSLAGMVALVAPLALAPFPAVADSTVEIVSDTPGFGQRGAVQGDFLLVHYTGRLADGTIFDTTKGTGLMYRDGGLGVFRPSIIWLNKDPVPGIVTGLKEGLLGMRVGGKRTIKLSPDVAFGSKGDVYGPYAVIPSGSSVTYEIEILRLNRVPADLMRGISRCGQGGAAASTEGCASVVPME